MAIAGTDAAQTKFSKANKTIILETKEWTF
jgi:hypothetical protein